MLDFSEWVPMSPEKGPPLLANWQIEWPSKEELAFTKPKEGPPLPRGLKIKWPWVKE